MPSMRFVSNVPAGGTVPNVLVGSAFEFAGVPTAVRVYASREADIAPGDDVVASVQFGPDVQLEPGPIAVEQSVQGGPRIPDNLVAEGVAAPGDRLQVSLRETGGANALNVTLQVFTDPIPL